MDESGSTIKIANHNNSYTRSSVADPHTHRAVRGKVQLRALGNQLPDLGYRLLVSIPGIPVLVWTPFAVCTRLCLEYPDVQATSTLS